MSTFCNYWNKVSLVKSKIKKSKKIDSIGIGLASPEEIRRWGERQLPNGTLIGKVDKDHTVDYESLKPIEGGLFCERIFGPVEDFYCSCERKGEKNEKFCPTCEVEFTKSRVRRIRMGYIPLAVPVVHVWYLRGRPSYIANLVGKSRNSIDRLAYGETLSESFIGYSSLESLYKKEDIHILEEENVFSKRLQDTSVAELRLPHYPLTPTGSGVLGNRSSATLDSCNDSSYKSSICTTHNKSSSRRIPPTKMDPNPLPVGYGVKGSWVHFSGANICTARVNPQRALYANSLQYPTPFTERACGGVRSTLKVTNPQPVPFVTAEKSVAGGSRAEKYPKEISFGHKQKYLKCHTLPLFSTFVYKEWAHRFSFLEYFTWSARNNDLVLPFYAYQNSKSKKRLPNICESLRKSAINLVRNKFSLRFSNKSNCNHSSVRSSATLRQLNSFEVLSCKSSIYPLPLTGSGVNMELRKEGVLPASTRVIAYPAKGKELSRNSLQIEDLHGTPHTLRSLGGLELCQRVVSTSLLAHPLLVNKSILQQQKVQPYFLQLRNKQGVLRVIKVKKDIGFLFHTKPNFYDVCSQLRVQRKPLQGIKMNNNFINNDELPRNQCSVKGVMLTNSVTRFQSGHKTSVAELRLPPTKMNPYGDANRRFAYPFGVWDTRSKEELAPLKWTHDPSTRSLPYLTPLPPRGMGYALRYGIRSSALQKGKGSALVGGMRERNSLLTPPHARSVQGMGYSRGLKNCYAFSPIQQDTESTPLNKMDTQQFPRLIELLNFTGGAALRNLLSRFDLIVLSKFLRHELKNLELKVNGLLALKILTYSQGLLLGKLAKRRSKQIRRLKLLELFQSQKSNPEWMILSVIPVLPPDLRPILRVNDDFVVASDLNRLYQTVLRRNNTIHERLDDPLPCPESGLFRQRSLQKAVDGLLENGKGGGTPLCASKRRPLVSLSHVLKGKKGLFRQHLLGKRVDYSGRSVIVVGPRLQVHECGLPKEMAIELFQPFLLHRLKVKGLATSNTTARRMIQQGNPVIWHLLKQLIYEHPVLLNRAPTLHRLGIQAFQPRLVSGRAILLHPLVCNGFNADFDGDQMAVHVPLSFQARAEAWKIMWSKNNFLSPATGQPILVPSQDMVLGCYYLSVSIPRILNSAAELRLPPTKMNPLQSKALHTPKGSGVRGTQSKHISKLGISTANQNLHNKAFLNENKGQYFSNLQDSLLAYFQGRLQTHTPFWVRIDHKLARENSVNNNNSSDAYPIPLQGKQIEDLQEVKLRSSATLDSSSLLHTPHTPDPLPLPLPRRGTGYGSERVEGSWGNRSSATLGKSSICIPRAIEKPRAITNIRKMKGVSNVQNAYPIPLQGKQIHFSGALHRGKELTFLQPLYGSSRQICKALFQNKSSNNFQIRVEANETLESPLELRLSVDGNLANILTMFQNYYNYNATWVKQCKEESIKYMRTTAGRVVINDVVFKDF